MRLGRRRGVSQGEAEQLTAEFAALGADAPVHALKASRSEDFPIHGKRNWRLLQLFLAVSTQWRVQVVAGLTKARVIYFGLDYPALMETARVTRTRISPNDFADLQAMERAALDELNRET